MPPLQLDRRTGAFIQLGRLFGSLAEAGPWPGFACGLNEAEYSALGTAVRNAGIANAWFTEANVRHRFGALAELLQGDELMEWAVRQVQPPVSARVGIIMAGNLPLVGFSDLLCAVIGGHIAVIKPSSQDQVLLNAVVEALVRLEPDLSPFLQLRPGKLGDVDAVIATGSNNSARYFEHYFGHLPLLLRKGRVSVAVLDGSESEVELAALGEDVFRYFGLGCRNVSKVYLPKDMHLDRLFGAFFPWQHVADHVKYANNYDYNKAVLLLERVPIMENGFLLLRGTEALASPVACLHYERYDDRDTLERSLAARNEELQCIVGHGHVPFGRSQYPGLDDHADGLDTMAFLAGVRPVHS